jgi:hypothetical protein
VRNSWFLVEILSSLAAIEAANDQYSADRVFADHKGLRRKTGIYPSLA